MTYCVINHFGKEKILTPKKLHLLFEKDFSFESCLFELKFYVKKRGRWNIPKLNQTERLNHFCKLNTYWIWNNWQIFSFL